MIDLDQGGLGQPWATTWDPTPSLRPYVLSVWAQEVPGSAPHRDWRIVPDASGHVLYQRLEGAGRTAASGGGLNGGRLMLVGPRSTFHDIDRRGRRFTAGLTLRPGALAALFRAPAHTFADRGVPLELVTSAGVAELRDQLDGSPGPARAAAALRDWAESLASVAAPLEPRVLHLMDSFTAGYRGAVGDVQAAASLSARRLRTLFRDHLGLSPKRAQRVVRAQRTCRFARDHGGHGSRIAISNGFYDEAHMIRDFKNLFGESLRAFLRRGDFRFLQSDGRTGPEVAGGRRSDAP